MRIEKNNQIKISIIVPVYNVENYIHRCLDSLMDQTYKNLEIILVDDGSTDSSGIICDEYSKKDRRIQVIHKKNGGLVSARKAGILLATGEYSTYVDSDDWIEDSAYEEMEKILEYYHPDVLTFGFEKEYSDFTIKRKEVLSEGFYTRERFLTELEKCIEMKLFFCPVVFTSVWSKIFKTELLKKNQIKVDDEIGIGEDAAVTFPYILETSAASDVYKRQYHYCARNNSILWRKNDDEFQKYLKLSKILINAWKKRGTDRIKYEKYLIYILYYYLLLCDLGYCFQRNKGCLLFPEIQKNDNILIYGKGLFSYNLIQNMQQTGLCNIIDCIDKNDVFRINNISVDLYRYIVIAIMDYEAVDSTLLLLEKLGIERNKILYIRKENLYIEELPEEVRCFFRTDYAVREK